MYIPCVSYCTALIKEEVKLSRNKTKALLYINDDGITKKIPAIKQSP